MPFTVLDPQVFLDQGMIRQDDFIARTEAYNWEQFRGQKVLVRGCSTAIPPWAYMIIASRLAGVARSVRFGNEHDNIVVHRNSYL